MRTLFIVFEEKYMEFVQGPGELSVMWRCPFDLAEGYYWPWTCHLLCKNGNGTFIADPQKSIWIPSPTLQFFHVLNDFFRY